MPFFDVDIARDLQVCLKDSSENVLMVLDDVESLPQSKNLRLLLKCPTTHIIVISHASQPPETLKREIDQQLIRGWSPISIQPLSTVHATQRIVHSIVSLTHFTPLNREQKLLERIAGLTSGCPGLVSLTNSLLHRCLEEAELIEANTERGFLDLFASKIHLSVEQPTHAEVLPTSGELSAVRPRAGSFRTNRYISEVISAFQLPPAHLFVLRTLSVFSPQPVPLSLVDIVQWLVAKASHSGAGTSRIAPNSITNLSSTKLLRPYPSPVICPPIRPKTSPEIVLENQQKYLFVPQLVQDALWDHMNETDIVFTITTAYRALLELTDRASLSGSELCCAAGLTETLIAKCDTNRRCINEGVYREVCKMLVSLQLRNESLCGANSAD